MSLTRWIAGKLAGTQRQSAAPPEPVYALAQSDHIDFQPTPSRFVSIGRSSWPQSEHGMVTFKTGKVSTLEIPEDRAARYFGGPKTAVAVPTRNNNIEFILVEGTPEELQAKIAAGKPVEAYQIVGDLYADTFEAPGLDEFMRIMRQPGLEAHH
jgi:hypothetical protein